MTFDPTQLSLPITQLDELVVKLNSYLPKPAMVSNKKWGDFKNKAVPLLGSFVQAHPDQVVSIGGACSADEFDLGKRFATKYFVHQVTEEKIDVNLYDEYLYGGEGEKQFEELFRALVK